MAVFGSAVCPVHDGVCACVASKLFFYTEVIYGTSLSGCYRVCLNSVLLNTVTTPAKHEHNERMEETNIYCHDWIFLRF